MFCNETGAKGLGYTVAFYIPTQIKEDEFME